VIEGGQRVAMISVIRDITERHEREARLRLFEAALRNVRESILMTDADLNVPGPQIIYANPAFEQMTGYSLAELAGQTPRMLQGPHTSRDTLARLRVSLERHETFVGEVVNYRKDGTPYTVEWSIGPVRDETGRVTNYVAVQRDVTERKRIEERLLEAQKLESLGVLAGGVAHDFNNLLMAVLGNVDLVQAQLPDSSPANAPLGQIKLAARRAADLTSQMLAYAGKGHFVTSLLDLNEVIVEMAHLLKTSTHRTASLSFSLTARLPQIEADPTQIRQVAMNLITNAAEAIGERAGAIRLETSRLVASRRYLGECVLGRDLAPGEYVALTVADSGCGMDAATQARIFEPFFTTKFTGRGLGLAAVHGIVRSHRGAIHVESRPDDGTTLTVLFRAAAPFDAVLAATPPHAAAPPIHRESAANKVLVLVIDDDQIVREASRKIVELLGYAALAAGSAEEGLATMREHAGEINCVLLDMVMPNISSEAMLANLRALRPDVPVLLMSGYNADEVNRRMEGRGLAGFLQKPFTLDQLRAALALALA